MKSELAKHKRLIHEISSGRSEKTQNNSMIFSEESKRIVYELGNFELYDFGQMSSTIQCSCCKHMPEGLKFCICGMCLRLDEDTIRSVEQ